MTTPSLIQTFGGDVGFGEASVSRNDDGSSAQIDLSGVFENGLNFFGATYTSLWVNTNGSVTFNGPLGTFTPSTISGGTVPGIFAFWGDVDTRDANEPNTSPGGNSQGTNLVWYDLDPDNGRFAATWDDTGFFSHNNSRVNAFQLILTDMSSSVGRAPGDFDIDFRYEWIDWTTGNASGGSGGLGGTPARAGYSAGNAAGTFFELPQSGIQDAILQLENTPGNTGLDGLWHFEVRNGDVPQTVTLSDGFDVIEGDSGTTMMEFMIERTGDIAGELTLDWTAVGFGATPANDADVAGPLPATGTVTFADGEAAAFVMIEVNGDTVIEPDEDVRLTLSNPVSTGEAQVIIGRSQGIGTIIDDDAPPPPPPPSITSWFWGDPHLITLDGLGYDFQAVGEFTLIESTAGDPLNIQVRTVPVGEVVSVITVMATEVDGHRVVIDANRATPLTIDGVAATVTAAGGPVDVGAGQIFEQDGMLIVVYPSGEQARVNFADSGDFLNVSLFLNDTRPAGSVRGLLGNLDANTANDLALPDGTVLSQPVDFATLYGQFADAWRITEADALFDRAVGETTADHQDPSFPRGVLSTADLPASVLAEATAAAQAAGITDPALLDAAILDFALTGDSAFVNAGASITAPPTATTVPANAPALASTLILDAPGDQPEGNAGAGTFLFTVHRIGDTANPITVSYTLGGDIAADDVIGALAGTIDFEAGQTSRTIAVSVAGDTVAENDEQLDLSIAVDPMFNTTVANSTASVLVTNDDGAGVPTLGIIAADSTEEGSGGATGVMSVVINRTGDTTAAASFTLTASAGPDGTDSAEAEDFDGGAFPVINGAFLPGETTVTVDILLAGDDAFEPDEGVTLTLGSTDTAVDPAMAENFAFIINDDTATTTATLGITAADSADEGSGGTGGMIEVVVTRTGNTAVASNFTVTASAGATDPAAADDFAGGAFPVVTGAFLAGETSVTVAIPLAGDDVFEPDEAVTLTLTSTDATVDAALAQAQAVIINDDPSEPIGQVLTGNAGSDTLTGGDGDDTIDGAGGTDTLVGGAGDDSMSGGPDVLDFDLRDVLFGQDGDDTLAGGAGNDELRGDVGNDILRGGFGVDNLFGGAGDDNINGGAWSDLVFGGAGNDTVNGGFGFDRINGGDGADQFFHLGVPDHGSDWIQDYSAAEGDTLFFGQTGDSADNFIVQTGVTGAAGSADVDEAFIVYVPSGQIIWALVDGAGQTSINLQIAGVEGTFDLLA